MSDVYHVWCDLREGVRDTDFADALDRYLGHLRAEGLIGGFRLTRRKLGLGPGELGEFHLMIEVRDLTQLEAAFGQVASRAGTVEQLHHGASIRWCGTRASRFIAISPTRFACAATRRSNRVAVA